MKMWNEVIETMPRKDLVELQLKKLRKTLKIAYEKAPLYHKKFDAAKIKPEDIRSLDDLKKIPIIKKDDVREEMIKTGDLFGGRSVIPLESYPYVWTSTGTSSLWTKFEDIPWTFIAHTKEDIEYCTEQQVRFIYMCGLQPPGWFFNPFFRWHPHAYLWDIAVEKAGFKPLQCSGLPADLERNLFLIWYLKPVAGFVGLSLLPELIAKCIEKGYEPSNFFSSFKWLFTTGDILTSAMREILKKTFINAEIYDYGGTQDVNTLYWCECPNAPTWKHMWEDFFIVECVDPESGEPVSPGEIGELVVTNIASSGIQTIRFNTEDHCILDFEKCACGRTHVKAKFYGRSAYRTKVKSKIFYPVEIEEIIREIEETKLSEFQIVKYAPEMDRLHLKITYDPKRIKNIDELTQKLKSSIAKKLGLSSEDIIIEWMKGMDILTHKIPRILKTY